MTEYSKYFGRWRDNIENFTRRYNFVNSFLMAAISALFSTIFLFYKTNFIMIIFIVAIFLFNILNWKFWIYFLAIFAVFSLFNFLNYQSLKNYADEKISGSFLVVNKFSRSIIIRYKYANILVNYSKEISSDFKWKIRLEGNIKIIENPSNFLIGQNTFLKLENVKIFDIFPTKNFSLNILIKKTKIAKKYLQLILLNYYDKYYESFDYLRKLNIFHYFTISGFHFGLLYFILNLLTKKIRSNIKHIIIFLILLIYLVILNFQISASRAFLFILITYINKKWLNKKFNNLSILTMVMIINLIFSFNIVFNYSFIFSYLITITILISINLFNFIKRYSLQYFCVTLVTYLSALFLSMNIASEINLLGFIYQIFFLPIASFTYMFSILFFWTNHLNYWYFLGFNEFIKLIYNGAVMLKSSKNIWLMNYVISALLLFSNEIKLLVKKTSNFKLNQSQKIIFS
ncbi:MAG0480 family ComEC-like protein [Metamycoplasma equirhinis]|uniref:MAG0480 family ComEC-like protein n=1 Tax=Metamycoplasma equirhinis TaxID=92402 RepID=UPI0035941D9C